MLKFWKKQRHQVVEMKKSLQATNVLYNFVSNKRFRFYTHQPYKENYLDTGQMNVKIAKTSFGGVIGTLLQMGLGFANFSGNPREFFPDATRHSLKVF